MARRRTGRDWQERAFEAAQLNRKDRENSAIPDLPNAFKDNVDLPKRSRWRWTAWGLAALIIAFAVRSVADSHGPPLATSCTTPAFALSTSSSDQGTVVRWTATGPKSSRFVLTIGVASFAAGAKPGQLVPVPDPGVTRDNTEPAATEHTMPSSCKANGAFTVEVAPATYTVRMFRIAGSGSDITATAVASKPLTVR